MLTSRTIGLADFRRTPDEDREPLEIRGGKRVYFASTELAYAVAFKAYNPDAVIVAGATELGVWRNKRGIEPATMLTWARIAE